MGFAWCSLITTVGAAQPGAAQPRSGSLRLVVDPAREWVVVGNMLHVRIGLRDAHNQPSPAPSEFVLSLTVTLPVAGAAPTVTIPAGQSAAALQLTPSAPGVLEIRATHPQAFDGGAFVRVVPQGRGVPEPATAAAAPDPKPASDDAPAPPAPTDEVGRSSPPPASAIEVGGSSAPPAPSSDPGVGSAGGRGPLARSDDDLASAPRLVLRYSPQRKLLADGKDAVTIQAFLLGDNTEPAGPTDGSGLKVNLFASFGTLAPQPLVVRGLEGRSTLTSDRPGDVDVEFVSSQPHIEVEGDRHLRVHFSPPIHGLRLEAKPAAISLVDQTDLVVTLIDAGGRAVATDEPRVVLLALDQGRGAIASKELTVKPGEFEARTRFMATGVGEVKVSAASTSLLNQTARIDVRLPLGLLALSVMGGMVGGLLAFFHRRRARWTRIAIGSVTGFLLYWTFIFGLMRVMPRAFVLNPLSNFALSTIGGWLGTEVFALLLQRLGLNQSRGREDHGGGKPKPKHGRTRRSDGA